MAQVADALKSFNYVIEINGLNQFLAQKVTIPEVTIEKVAHADTNHDVKTPGRYSVADIVIEKLKPITKDDWAWQWLLAGADPSTGGGAGAINVAKLVIIREMDSTGLIAVNTYLCERCWVTKLGRNVADRSSSDNVIETVTLSTDFVRPI